MKRLVVMVIISGMVFSGCASGPVDLPLGAITPQQEVVKSNGKLTVKSDGSIVDGNLPDIGTNTTTAVVQFSDSRVASEAIIGATLKQALIEYRKAYASSGMNIEYSLVDMGNGVKALLPTKQSYREKPDFAGIMQRIPSTPSDHPGWATAKSLGHDLIFGTLIWKGIDTVGGMFKTLGTSAKSSTTYNGPVIKQNADNVTGRDNVDSGQYSGPVKIGDENNPSQQGDAALGLALPSVAK